MATARAKINLYQWRKLRNANEMARIKWQQGILYVTLLFTAVLSVGSGFGWAIWQLEHVMFFSPDIYISDFFTSGKKHCIINL